MVKKMDLEQQFEKEFTVSQYECDLNNRMKASAIMRQVQQVSTDPVSYTHLDVYKRQMFTGLSAKAWSMWRNKQYFILHLK